MAVASERGGTPESDASDVSSSVESLKAATIALAPSSEQSRLRQDNGHTRVLRRMRMADPDSEPAVDGAHAHSNNTTTSEVALSPASRDILNGRKRPSDESPVTSSSARNSDRAQASHLHKEAYKRVKLNRLIPHSELDTRGTMHQQNVHPAQDFSQLPAEIWAHISTYTPPSTLADLSQISHRFRTLLLPSNPVDAALNGTESNGSLKLIAPNDIWTASRKLFFPNMRAPLEGRSEIDMWKLLRSKKCQFCGGSGSTDAQVSTASLREPALGTNGVRIIWPFGVRSCGGCLLEMAETEMNLLISSSLPLMLLPALPCVFVTPELRVITAEALRKAITPPPAAIAKYFWKAHVEEIKQKFEEVKAGGLTAVEDWIKGLEGQGRSRLATAGQWEQWELSEGLEAVKWRPMRQIGVTSPLPSALVSSMPTAVVQPEPDNRLITSDSASADRNGLIDPPRRESRFSSVPFTSNPRLEEASSADRRRLALALPSRLSDSPTQGGPANFSSSPIRRGRVERTATDVAELKALRRAEIEKRCSELGISSGLLNYMDSFRNAMQISMPLTDSQWEVLKPLLESQRESAQAKENDRVAQGAVDQVKLEERREQESRSKVAKELQEKEWEEVQGPIRLQLGEIADALIKQQWADGAKVTKDNCAKFAADILIAVRARFYQAIAEEDAQRQAMGLPVQTDRPSAPPTRKLILDNMKWLFDFKIKAITEKYRKELFLCHGCENPTKFHGFEGVIQHFAAKHTNALSQGNIVVHWKGAEWPEHPPFHPDPAAVSRLNSNWAPHHHHPHHQSSMGYPSTGLPPSSAYDFGSFPHGQSGRPPMPASNDPSRMTQYNAGPYQQAAYGEHYVQRGATVYPGQQNFPGSAPGPGYPINARSYQAGGPGPQGPGLPMPHGFPPGPGPGPGYDGYSSSYPVQAALPFGSPHPNAAYATQHPAAQGPPHGYGASHPPVPPLTSGPRPLGPYGAPYAPSGPAYGPHRGAPQGPLPPHLPQQGPPLLAHNGPPHAPAPVSASGFGPSPTKYHADREVMATIARDLWGTTSGIKDLSSAIRAHVIIHQTVNRFKERMGHPPTLDMFIDALENHSRMKPINNLKGLFCKACQDGRNGAHGAHGAPHSHPPRYPSGDRKPHTLPILLNHFRATHQDRGDMPPKDWSENMVELPEASVIRNLENAQGIEMSKLQVIARVFPEIFLAPAGLDHDDRRTIGRHHADRTSAQAGSNGAHAERRHDRPLGGAVEDRGRRESDSTVYRARDPRGAPQHKLANRMVAGYPFNVDSPIDRDGSRQMRSMDRRESDRRPDRDVAGYSREGGPTGPDTMMVDDPASLDRARRQPQGRRTPHEYYYGSREEAYQAESPAFIRDTARTEWRAESQRAEGRLGRRHLEGVHGLETRTESPGRRLMPPTSAMEGSEDGELGEDPRERRASEAPLGAPTETVNPADQFLDTIAPPPPAAPPLVTEDTPTIVMNERLGHHARPSDVVEHRSGEKIVGPTAVVGLSGSGTPLGESHSRRSMEPFPAHQIDGHGQMRRPRSRYDRYESARASSRSRSPGPRGTIAHSHEPLLRPSLDSPTRYEPVYRTRSPPPVMVRSSRHPEDERRGYISGPSTERYITYVGGRGRAEYEAGYGPPMAYVPGRRRGTSPAARVPGPYVVEEHASRAEDLVEYQRLEDEIRGGRYVRENGRLYRLEDTSLPIDDPRGAVAQSQMRY